MISSRELRKRANLCGVVLLGGIVLGCESGPPEGQVVARVDQMDITAREIDFEIEAGEHANRQAALQAVVDRKILVQEARSRGLDLEDSYHFAERRAREGLLVEALARDVSDDADSFLEEQAWIAINRAPWRYKDRTRLYLTRGDEEAGKTVFWVDSADYESEPPEEVIQAQPGDILTLNDQDWEVHVREARVLPPDEMLSIAQRDLSEQKQEAELSAIVERYRQTGRTVYQLGYGPADAGPSETKPQSDGDVAGDSP